MNPKYKKETDEKLITDIAQPREKLKNMVNSNKKKNEFDIKDKNNNFDPNFYKKPEKKLEYDIQSSSQDPLLNIVKILYDDKTYEVFNLIVKYISIGDDEIDNKLQFGNTEINKSLTILENDRLIRKIENKNREKTKVQVSKYKKVPDYLGDLDKKIKIFRKNLEKERERLCTIEYFCKICNETYNEMHFSHFNEKCRTCNVRLVKKEDNVKLNFEIVEKIMEKVNENYEKCKLKDLFSNQDNGPLQRLEYNLTDHETMDNLNFFDKKNEDELRFFSELCNFLKK